MPETFNQEILNHAGRIQNLKLGENEHGPVVYWMSRDHRSRDNWALLHAVHQAREKGVPVAVAFNLVESFLEARARHFGFMLRGLRVVEQNLKAVNIPFFLFRVCPFSATLYSLCACTIKFLILPCIPYLFWLKSTAAASGQGVCRIKGFRVGI